MKRNSKILWGLILAFVGIAVVCYAVFPELVIINLPLWKIITAIILLYFIINNVLFGRGIAERLDIFIPAALGLIIFKDEIVQAAGLSKPYNAGLIFVAAIILTVANHLIFDRNEKTKNVGTDKRHGFAASTEYIDATAADHVVSSNCSSVEVFFQNVQEAKGDIVLELDVARSAVQINVPDNWYVDYQMLNTRASAVDVKKNAAAYEHKIILKGTCRYSALEIR